MFSKKHVGRGPTKKLYNNVQSKVRKHSAKVQPRYSADHGIISHRRGFLLTLYLFAHVKQQGSPHTWIPKYILESVAVKIAMVYQ